MISASDDLIRRKRLADASPINKNVKKVYRADYASKYRKSPKNPRYARPALKIVQIPTDSESGNTRRYFQSIPTRIYNLDIDNHLQEAENTGSRTKRQKRSFDAIYDQKYKAIRDNGINRFEDPEINEIWNNLIEMEQDEQLLNEYNRQKGQTIHKETQRNFQRFLPSMTTQSSTVDAISTAKIAESTTQVNLESMLVDAIPKLEGVITGGLVKAQNLTGSLEDFIEKFDDEEPGSNATETSSSGNVESIEEDDGKISHNIFQHMVGSVKKFFGLLSNLAKIFHEH